MAVKKNYYGLRGTKLNIAIAVIAGTDFALFGYDQVPVIINAGHLRRLIPSQGVLGGLLTLPSFLKFFPQVDVNHPPPGWTASKTSNVQGITVGGYTLGCFFGAVATIWLGNLLGRRKTIFVGSSIMVVGAALQCSAFSKKPLGIISTGYGFEVAVGFSSPMFCIALAHTGRKQPQQKQLLRDGHGLARAMA
jgi:MFS family permease